MPISSMSLSIHKQSKRRHALAILPSIAVLASIAISSYALSTESTFNLYASSHTSISDNAASPRYNVGGNELAYKKGYATIPLEMSRGSVRQPIQQAFQSPRLFMSNNDMSPVSASSHSRLRGSFGKQSNLSENSRQLGGFQSRTFNSNEISDSCTSSLQLLNISQQELGFRISNNEHDDDDLHFRLEDFEQCQHLSMDLEKELFAQDFQNFKPQTSSLMRKPVSVSLLCTGQKKPQWKVNSDIRSLKIKSRSFQSISNNISEKKKKVPPWFPSIPTRSQIMCLKVAELRAACKERGLINSGKKAELQRRLHIWATVQDKKRVKDRLAGLMELVHSRKDTAIDEAELYDVKKLTDRRKAMTQDMEKVKTNSRSKKGILGLVDHSFFDTNITSSDDMSLTFEDDVEVENDRTIVDEKSISQLSRSFNAPSSNFSNREVREMYLEAKAADQAGDRMKCKKLLFGLREATPNDMRVVRRLARMEQEDGNLSNARMLLQHALRKKSDCVHLLHGLGQLERQAGNDSAAIKYYREAIKKDPTFANPYHALGTLEHTHGNIKVALAVIQLGLKHCPKNHRLHHALGDIYLDANMLDLAENSYLTGLRNDEREWGKSFVFTSLSFVSYAKGDINNCRNLLRRALDINGGMHAQGVIALAQLEESEGNLDMARTIYRNAISKYERKRTRRRSIFSTSVELEKGDDPFDTKNMVKGLERNLPRSYPGDKWINVLRSWSRMERIHGTYETAHIVFSRAVRLFPDSTFLLIDWANLQSSHNDLEKATLLFEAACQRINGRSADPYTVFADFQLRRRHFHEAQSILFRGAQSVTESSVGNVECNSGLASLYHTWGICEYHLGNKDRAELLFDDALRVTGSGEADAYMRSLILYSMAKLEFSREEYLLAQHCVALSLKENLFPGGNSLTWNLWADIAEKMENQHLFHRCKEQAALRYQEESGGTASEISRMLEERGTDRSIRSSDRTGAAMKDMFRKTPWYSKVCEQGRMDKKWYDGASLWDL